MAGQDGTRLYILYILLDEPPGVSGGHMAILYAPAPPVHPPENHRPMLATPMPTHFGAHGQIVWNILEN